MFTVIAQLIKIIKKIGGAIFSGSLAIKKIIINKLNNIS